MTFFMILKWWPKKKNDFFIVYKNSLRYKGNKIICIKIKGETISFSDWYKSVFVGMD